MNDKQRIKELEELLSISIKANRGLILADNKTAYFKDEFNILHECIFKIPGDMETAYSTGKMYDMERLFDLKD